MEERRKRKIKEDGKEGRGWGNECRQEGKKKEGRGEGNEERKKKEGDKEVKKERKGEREERNKEKRIERIFYSSEDMGILSYSVIDTLIRSSINLQIVVLVSFMINSRISQLNVTANHQLPSYKLSRRHTTSTSLGSCNMDEVSTALQMSSLSGTAFPWPKVLKGRNRAVERN